MVWVRHSRVNRWRPRCTRLAADDIDQVMVQSTSCYVQPGNLRSQRFNLGSLHGLALLIDSVGSMQLLGVLTLHSILKLNELPVDGELDVGRKRYLGLSRWWWICVLLHSAKKADGGMVVVNPERNPSHMSRYYS
jgi:hypothetical protein